MYVNYVLIAAVYSDCLYCLCTVSYKNGTLAGRFWSIFFLQFIWKCGSEKWLKLVHISDNYCQSQSCLFMAHTEVWVVIGCAIYRLCCDWLWCITNSTEVVTRHMFSFISVYQSSRSSTVASCEYQLSKFRHFSTGYESLSQILGLKELMCE